MKALEEKIRKQGKILPGDVLKIDSFLNHQIDVEFTLEIGKEFKKIFADCQVDKILTVESSGIAVGFATSQFFNNCPIVFAKKGGASNMDDNVYGCELYSYTRQKSVYGYVSKEYLKEGENVLILDDFLANGQALNALLAICDQAKVNVVGIGVVVEKAYQPGGALIRERGFDVKALARVSKMTDDSIEFCD